MDGDADVEAPEDAQPKKSSGSDANSASSSPRQSVADVDAEVGESAEPERTSLQAEDDEELEKKASNNSNASDPSPPRSSERLGSGEEEEGDEARRDSEEGKRDSTESKRDSGEEARRDSEESRRDSEESRRDSEESRRDSDESRRDSEESRRDSEESRRDSDESRRDSEDARKDSTDAKRDSAEEAAKEAAEGDEIVPAEVEDDNDDDDARPARGSDDINEIPEPPQPPPVFTCHEASYVPNNAFVSRKQPRHGSTAAGSAGDTDMDSESGFQILSSFERKRHAKLNVEELEFRPAALTQNTQLVRQIQNQIREELQAHKCHRLPLERIPPPPYGRSHHQKRESVVKIPSESMERKFQRLRIYKRAFGGLVIYFRAYGPLLFFTKKTFDEMVAFRLKQFRESQHEKIRMYNQNVVLEHKMSTYRFPDYKRLKKAEQYLHLLFIRIRKQDEAIKFVTEILSKVERCLSEHYEKYRDMEDQIKMLDGDLTEIIQRGLKQPQQIVVPESPSTEEANGDKRTSFFPAVEESKEEIIEIDEDEVIDEDKKMVLILAYSVCLHDLEEAQKKLKELEREYKIRQKKKRRRLRMEARIERCEEDEDECGSDEEDSSESSGEDNPDWDAEVLEDDEEEEDSEEEEEDEEEEDEDEEEEDEEQDDEPIATGLDF